MPTFTTLRDAFGYFGAKAANPVWAWAAQSDDGATVVVTMWSHLVRHQEGRVIYDVRGTGDLAMWGKRPGNKDRHRKLRHAQEHNDGLFRVVHIEAVDAAAAIKSTKSKYRADGELMMKIVELRESGEFLAHSV